MNVAQDGNPSQLFGTWELREAQDGMTPNKTYVVGNGDKYKFSETAYERYTDGSLVKTGTYRVVRDTTVQNTVGLTVPPGQFTNRIVFDNNPSDPQTFYQIEAGKLILLAGYFPTDGGSRRAYEKTETGR